MKEYRVLDVSKSNAEKTINDMAKNRWEVVAVTYWYNWKISLVITFSKNI